MIQSPNLPDITPSFGQHIPNATIKTELRQSIIEDYTTTNYCSPLTVNNEMKLMMSPEESNDCICVTDLQNLATCVPLPLKQEVTLPVVTSANNIVNLNGYQTKPTSTIQLDTLPKLQNNLIASAMDWPKITSKTHLKPKDEYIKFLKDNLIINNRHYELFLSNYPYLANFETKISTDSLESLKKTIFRQNYLIIQNSNMLEN